MADLSARARLILRHITTSKFGNVAMDEMVRFSPVDGGIVDMKSEARENASAVQELIRAGFVDLWVVDRWTVDRPESGGRTGDVRPELVLMPSETAPQVER
ncbi:MAG: hypothetical protein ACKVXR_03900 [Planctomycetota bacterium]